MNSQLFTFAWFHKMAVAGIDLTKKMSSIMDSEAHSPGTHQRDDSGSNLLDPFRINRDQYLADRNGNIRGTANPSIMDKPFWKYMIAGGLIWKYLIAREGSVFSALKKHHLHFDEEDLYKDLDENPDPEWCFDRFGGTATELPDGRLVLIGGEHEDSYDPDCCIYNDVVVIAPPQPSNLATSFAPEDDVIPDDCRIHRPYPTSPESITIYGYPVDVFPPTDFHTSTYFCDPINGKEFMYIIGGLGYIGSPSRDRTDVYRLDLIDFSLQLLETSGEKPAGGTYHHKALLVGDGEDTEAAIKILTKDGKAFSLLIKKLEWISHGPVTGVSCE